MSNLPEGYGSETTANSYYTHKNSLQLNCPFSTEARFFLAWVLHKIHLLITLKCILIIYTDLTVSSMEKEILYKIIGSVGLILAVSDLWEDMRFNQSAVVFFFLNWSRNCLAITCTFQLLFCYWFCLLRKKTPWSDSAFCKVGPIFLLPVTYFFQFCYESSRLLGRGSKGRFIPLQLQKLDSSFGC